jgi:threonine/homoserine/homoserine lactone efflux protein
MLGEVIGGTLTLALGVALSPIPIIGVVLMLATPRGRGNGLGFLAGWVAGLALVGTIVLLVVGAAGASDGGEPASWVSVLKLVFGLALLLLAFRQWRARPEAGAEPPLPKWMEAIDTFTTGRAIALGFALAAVNPKNLLLTAAAAATIAQAGMSSGDEAIALAVFVVVGTLGPGAPVAIYFAAGRRAHDILAELRHWLEQNNTVIMAVLLLVIGTKLIGDAIAGLS